MKTISIRELHRDTGLWVRYAATRGSVLVTDRGRKVAALGALKPSLLGRPLPDREARVLKRSRIEVDSAAYLSDMRERA